MNTTRGKQRIMKVFDYQVNREKGDMMMKILDLICTEAHVNHSLCCQVNGALQKKLLIEIVLKQVNQLVIIVIVSFIGLYETKTKLKKADDVGTEQITLRNSTYLLHLAIYLIIYFNMYFYVNIISFSCNR